MEMTMWDSVTSVFLALGGLGLFLLGLKTMSDGLKDIAGSRMRSVIGKATSNKFLGLLFGAVVTAITQSSTATSVMAIGFVNAGLMNLVQFASIIIGASVGSTLTAIFFNFGVDPVAPLLIFLGIALHIFFSRKNVKSTGLIILGIGILFFGLTTMSVPLREFSQMDGFAQILRVFESPVLALITGILFTAIIQSSAATIGIIIVMYLGGIDMSFSTAAFLVLGANIGTCSTALLSSLAAGRESKRAALIHVSYKLITGGVCALLLLIFPAVLVWFQSTWQDGAMQITMFHVIYNIGAATIMIFFTKQLVRLVHFIIPKQPSEDNEKKLIYLEENKERAPEVVFTQAENEMLRMGRIVQKNLRLSLEAFFERDLDKANKVIEIEATIDFLRNEITEYLTGVQSTNITPENLEQLGSMLHIVTDIERLGDHAENIAEYIVGERTCRAYLSNSALDELYEISLSVRETLDIALDTFEEKDITLLSKVELLEQKVDDLCDKYLTNHIDRLSEESCDPRSSVVYTGMISDLERCSDHALNIAEKTFGSKLKNPKNKQPGTN